MAQGYPPGRQYYPGPGAGEQAELQFMVPDIVKQFVSYFYRHIRERNTEAIWSMYDVSFNKLSERYFKNTPWPPVEAIAHIVDHDHVFCLLYKEAYYRHLYLRVMPTLEDRVGSWDNYCQLFNIILEAPINMQLPNGWLWDMVDEFCFQFHNFNSSRARLVRNNGDIEILSSNPHLWHINDVMGMLKALTDRSGIRRIIAEDGGKSLFETEGYSDRESNVLKMLGYFAMVGQLRCLTIIGEYESAIRALEPIEIFNRQTLLAAKLTTCNITLFYYAGFSYFMLGRYLDATRCFNTVIGFINRITAAGSTSRPGLFEQMLKRNEQLFSLLAVTVALCPRAQRLLDESVANALMAKHRDIISAIGRNDGVDALRDRFAYACPRFINPDMPNYSNATELNHHNDVFWQAQAAKFAAEVEKRKHVPSIRQYLSLYASIGLPKLAKLMGLSLEDVRTVLNGYKRCEIKTWNEHCGADLLGGEVVNTADVEFILDLNMDGQEVVSVREAKTTRRHSDALIKHVRRFQDIVAALKASGPLITPTAA